MIAVCRAICLIQQRTRDQYPDFHPWMCGAGYEVSLVSMVLCLRFVATVCLPILSFNLLLICCPAVGPKILNENLSSMPCAAVQKSSEPGHNLDKSHKVNTIGTPFAEHDASSLMLPRACAIEQEQAAGVWLFWLLCHCVAMMIDPKIDAEVGCIFSVAEGATKTSDFGLIEFIVLCCCSV